VFLFLSRDTSLPVRALPLGKLDDCLGRRANGAPKIQLCGSESDERTPKKIMNIMKMNETTDHAVDEKIKVLHYYFQVLFFRFSAEGLILFLLISISNILGKLCRNSFLMYKTFFIIP